ncbi:MAG: beta-lactamase family protein [Puniceicoccales bacterium]|jgi:CubicO group peptidase (beta-lactamase class C family)|nr:beta-lactamase family protein [Puniceicoccales bacterium]
MRKANFGFWPKLKLGCLGGVTVKDLLTHSSKIDYFSGEKLTEYKYQNLNFDLIGRILEKQTGKSYEALTHELFREVGMTNTFLHNDIPEKELFAKLKESLKLINRRPGEVTDSATLSRAMNPSGGIISTARDLLKWNGFLDKNGHFEKLAEFSVDTSGDDRYGFGIVTDSKKSFFYHNGAISLNSGAMYVSVLFHDPKTKFSAIAFDVIEKTPPIEFWSMSLIYGLAVRKVIERIDWLTLKCVE